MAQPPVSHQFKLRGRVTHSTLAAALRPRHGSVNDMNANVSAVPALDPLGRALSAEDPVALSQQFADSNEMIVLQGLLTAEALAPLLEALPALAPHVHRNYIPGHKKGGSISRFQLNSVAPAFDNLYRDPALIAFLSSLCGQPLILCPDDDPHGCALYYYTEAGDHIGFHYDTSYYKGQRYTVLIGLVDESSCRLEYELFRDDPARETITASVALEPGTVVAFNGDRLYHRVTPSAPGENRIALTLEYVTSHRMHPWRRFISNMKDAIAYFGFRQVFSRSGQH